MFIESKTPTANAQSVNLFSVAFSNRVVKLFEKSNLKVIFEVESKSRTNSICIGNNLLLLAQNQGSIQIFDTRTSPHCISQLKCGRKYTSIDLSQQIVAAASGKNILFYDLRKMKQRDEFKNSFADDISHLSFDHSLNTVLKACSFDGSFASFDLTLSGEENSLTWAYRIVGSPIHIDFQGREGIVQTCQHSLIRFRDQSPVQTFQINSIQSPRHIVYSKLKTNLVEYCEHDLTEEYVTKKIGVQCVGIAKSISSVEVAVPINNSFVYFDQNGIMGVRQFENPSKCNIQPIYKSLEKIEIMAPEHQQQKRNEKNTKSNNISSISKAKKFRPY